MTTLPVAIVVDADQGELRITEKLMSEAGFSVTAVDTFNDAKALIASVSPEVIVADVKLRAYNGLHLAALCATQRPSVVFITTHEVYDRVLEADARRLGALYVLKTKNRDELKKTVLQILAGRKSEADAIRKWPRKMVAHAAVATVAADDTEVVDVSYGGARLKLRSRNSRRTSEQLPETFDLVFPDLALALHVARVWSAPDPGASDWVCGVDISENDVDDLERWRVFVDSVG
jgi:DNA-binding response OmpR family regulator